MNLFSISIAAFYDLYGLLNFTIYILLIMAKSGSKRKEKKKLDLVLVYISVLVHFISPFLFYHLYVGKNWHSLYILQEKSG
jgi:hypothetical protein